MTVNWKSHFRNNGVKADDAFNQIETLRARLNGQITPADLVADSKKKRSACNPLFEWDDKEAAKAHRETQAGDIIRNIVIVHEDNPDLQPRAFQTVQIEQPEKSNDQPRSVYVSTEDALRDPAMREQVLRRAISELNAFKRKYHELEELARVIDAIGDLAA
jgi:hypothetical protein